LEIHGLDFNPDMVAIAKKKVPSVSFKVADMKTYKYKQKFDVVTALFSVFGYNLTRRDLKKALKNAYIHLKPGGYLLFDIGFVKDTYPGEHTDTSFDHFKKGPLKLTRVYNSEVHGAVTHFNYTILTEKNGKKDHIYGVHKIGSFAIKDIKQILKEIGFKVEVLDVSTYKKFNKKSFAPLFVCKKI